MSTRFVSRHAKRVREEEEGSSATRPPGSTPTHELSASHPDQHAATTSTSIGTVGTVGSLADLQEQARQAASAAKAKQMQQQQHAAALGRVGGASEAPIMGPRATKSLVQIVAEERMKQSGISGDGAAVATGSAMNASSSSKHMLAVLTPQRIREVQPRASSWQSAPSPIEGPGDVHVYAAWRELQHVTCRVNTGEFPRPVFEAAELRLREFCRPLSDMVKFLRPLQQHALPCALSGLNTVAIGPSGCGKSLVLVSAVMQALAEATGGAGGSGGGKNPAQNSHSSTGGHNGSAAGMRPQPDDEHAAAATSSTADEFLPIVALVLCGSRESEQRYRQLLRNLVPFRSRFVGRLHERETLIVVAQPNHFSKDLEGDDSLRARISNLKVIVVADGDRLARTVEESWEKWFGEQGHHHRGGGTTYAAPSSRSTSFDDASPSSAGGGGSGASPSKSVAPPVDLQHQPQVVVGASSFEAVRALVQNRVPHPFLVQLLDAAAWTNIAHVVNCVPEKDMMMLFLDVVQRTPGPALVVAAARNDGTEALDMLRQLGCDATDDVSAFSTSSDYSVLVATDVALVGAKLPALRHIINLSLPSRDTMETLSMRTRYFSVRARSYLCLMSTIVPSTLHPEAAAELATLLKVTHRQVPAALQDVRRR